MYVEIRISIIISNTAHHQIFSINIFNRFLVCFKFNKQSTTLVNNFFIYALIFDLFNAT